MNYDSQKTALATLLAGIPDIGLVHDRPRYGDAYEHWVTPIGGVPQVRAWEIGIDPQTGIRSQRITEIHVGRYISWLIQGYISLVDSDGTYLTAVALAEQIRETLDANRSLDGTCLDLVGPNGGTIDIDGPDALFIGGDVLCWGITLRFTTYDIDEVVPA